MIDALIPQIEKARSEGAIVILKWDGERTHNHCTVVVTRHDTDYVWRKDSIDIEGTLAEAMSEYQRAHAHDAQSQH
jgi:hypothetical protein